MFSRSLVILAAAGEETGTVWLNTVPYKVDARGGGGGLRAAGANTDRGEQEQKSHGTAMLLPH